MTTFVSGNTNVVLSKIISGYSFGYDDPDVRRNWYNLYHSFFCSRQDARAKASDTIFALASFINDGDTPETLLSALDIISNFIVDEQKVWFYNFIYAYIRFGPKAISSKNLSGHFDYLDSLYDSYEYDVEVEKYFSDLLGSSAWSFIYSSSDNFEVYTQADSKGFVEIEGQRLYSSFPTSLVKYFLSSAQNCDTAPYEPCLTKRYDPYWSQAKAKIQVSYNKHLPTFSCDPTLSCDLVNSDHSIVEKFISDEKREHFVFINAFRGHNPRIQKDLVSIKRTTKIRFFFPITTQLFSFSLLDGLKPVTVFRFAVNISLEQAVRYKNTIKALYKFFCNIRASDGRSITDEEAWLQELDEQFVATSKYYDSFKEFAKNFEQESSAIVPVKMCANTDLLENTALTPEQYKYQGVKLIKTLRCSDEVNLNKKHFKRLEKTYNSCLSRKKEIENQIEEYSLQIRELTRELVVKEKRATEVEENLDSLSQNYFSKKQELEDQTSAIEAECFAIMEADSSYNWLSTASQSNIELKECYYHIPILMKFRSNVDIELREEAKEFIEESDIELNRIPLSSFPKIAYYANNDLPLPLSVFLSDESVEFIVSQNYGTKLEGLCIPKLSEVNFSTKRPSLIKIDGKLDKAVAGGPYNVQVSVHSGSVDYDNVYRNQNSPELKISLKDSNSVFGFSGKSFKIHPHTNDMSVQYLPSVDMSNLSNIIDRMVQTSTTACLGDALPSMYKAFASADIKLLVYTANAWIESANSSDVWGAYYKHFPHHTLVRFDKEETKEAPATKEITVVDIVNIIDELQENISSENTDSPEEVLMEENHRNPGYIPFVIIP